MPTTKKLRPPAPKKRPRKPEATRVYLLRTVDAKHQSFGGFQWPKRVGATVTAPDWDPSPECGNGLHGLPWGQGEVGLLSSRSDAIWQVVSTPDARAGFVAFDGKAKCRTCRVEYIGNRDGAIAFLATKTQLPLPWGTATAGYGGTATAGYGGTATAGYGGTATAGYEGIISLTWHDGARYRLKTGYVGEKGILPNVAYRLDEHGKFIARQEG